MGQACVKPATAVDREVSKRQALTLDRHDSYTELSLRTTKVISDSAATQPPKLASATPAAANTPGKRDAVWDSAQCTDGQSFRDWAVQESKRANQATEAFVKRSLLSEDILDSGRSSFEVPSFGGSSTGSGDLDTLPPFRPFDAFLHGPPKPACHDERTCTANGINKLRATRDGEIESLLRLLCTIFEAETATVALLTGECIYLTGACGALPVCVCPDRWGFCGWSFLNSSHEQLVVEDMKQDVRFSENYFVVEPQFHLEFYCATPLVAANGHRLGTLCIMGQQPRKFDSTRASVLANLGEMLVRQLERSWALQQAEDCGARLMRSLACYEAAFLFVDTRGPQWRVLHMNNAAIDQLGAAWDASYAELANYTEGRREKQAFSGVLLEDLFDFADSSTLRAAPPSQCQGGFTVLNALRKDSGVRFNLFFKTARSEGLDQHQPFGVGIPSFLPESPTWGANYYLVSLTPAQQGPDGAVAPYRAPAPIMPVTGPFEGLMLGPLVGQGGYGKVYRGTYHGMPVAVKIVDDATTLIKDDNGVPLEAALTADVHHMSLARVVEHAFWTPPHALNAAAPAEQCWLLMEYCSMGCLTDAVTKGWFRTSRIPTQGATDYRTVALTALEVASAMQIVHKAGISHGDLSGGNVMLTASAVSLHGFAAKVSDFGLARCARISSRTSSNSYGTVTYMPVEVLLNGDLTPAADMYAFGVLLWEMMTGTRAWAGLRHAQIMCQVALLGRTLADPVSAPLPLRELCRRCLSADAAARPPFTEIVTELTSFVQNTRGTNWAAADLPL